MTDICTLVVCGAPLARRAPEIAAELVRAGWQVRTVMTPAAEQWVDLAALEAAAGGPARLADRTPDQPKARERATAIAVVPMTFNSVGKLVHGVADTLAHSTMAEALGEHLPFVAVPMVNNYLAENPAWQANVEHLTRAGVTWISMVDGTAGEPDIVKSGTGEALVEAFDPEWVSGQLPTISESAWRQSS